MSGIPQGSCLGSLFFILYINDFENGFENMTLNVYADDICVSIASENLNELLTGLKNELENISSWMRINKLNLYATKSEYMVIGHRRKLNRVGDNLPHLFLNDQVIKRAEKAKYLGISVDESLNWKEPYKTVKNTLKGGINTLRKLKSILPQRKLEQVYKALFESHLCYGDIVWNALSSAKLCQLQRLQTRTRRLIEDAKYKDGWNCKWLDVKSLASFDQGAMTYKILHSLCPENPCHKIVERSIISEYGTRIVGSYSWRPPRGDEQAQRNTALMLIVIRSLIFRIGADVDGLWQTIQPDPFNEYQAQQFQAAVLISNCLCNRVECVYLAQSLLLNNMKAPRASPSPAKGVMGQQIDRQMMMMTMMMIMMMIMIMIMMT